MLEEDFLQQVREYAHLQKCKTYHTRNSKGSDKGLPDLIIVRNDFGVKWRELKVPPNDLSPDQEEWLEVLINAGEDAGVWTPADFSEIEADLKLRVNRRKCRIDHKRWAVPGTDLCHFHGGMQERWIRNRHKRK